MTTTIDPAAMKSEPSIRVMMMPRDTNAHGTIFGGVILSYLDQAGAIEARKLGCSRVVTVAMDRVEFKQPVFVGDLLSFYSEIISTGKRSARVRVSVMAERWEAPAQTEFVTTAELVYVAIGDDRKAIPWGEEPTRQREDA
ncbi:MAG TPA: hotdog domain-containing protein [Phycisphaerae bacterium]|nr:hotdog domain-containing protein [Phycisphaerae bacterium]